jgi:hypothetical protein
VYKIILKSLLVLSFASSAFAQTRNAYIKNAVPKYGDHRAGQKTVTTTTRTYRTAAAPQAARTATQPTETSQTLNRIETQAPSYREDQWANYLMKGLSVGFEYSSLGGSVHVEGKMLNGVGISTSGNGSSDPASVIGVSMMYNQLHRDNIGFSAGGTVYQKVENNNGSSGLKSTDAFTSLRPEANLLYGHSSGFWSGIGAHMNYIAGSGEMTDGVQQLGYGAQLRIGFVPARHLNFDLGYSVTIHKLGDKIKDVALAQGFVIDDGASYYSLNQWALRATYMF